jgi:uridylate kinase
MSTVKFKRVLLKLSGESLMGVQGFGISSEVLDFFADEVKKVHDVGVQLDCNRRRKYFHHELEAYMQLNDRWGCLPR